MFSKIKKLLIYMAIFALAIQSTMILSFLNPQKAYAGNPGDPTKVLINEFISHPAIGEKEKIEIYNTNLAGTEPIDISYWYIADANNERLDAFGSPEKGTLVEPGEFYVFENGGSSSILNDNEDDIYLWGYDWPTESGYEYNVTYPETAIPQTFDNLNYGNDDSDLVAPPAQGKSAGSLPDGTNTWYPDLYPTLGSANIRDTIAPTSTITYPVNNGYYNSLDPITGTDSDTGGSDIDKVEVKIENNSLVTDKYFSGTGWTSTETWLAATSANSWAYNGLNNSFLTNGEAYTISSRATDNAGNVQSPVNSIIFNYDITAPTGTISINNNATVTNSYLVTLTLASTDAAQMMVSNDANFTSASWEEFATTRSWSLTAGDKTTKTVYVKFKDTAGNISTVYSDTIYLNLDTSNVVASNIIVGTQTITPAPGLELIINGLTNTTLTTATYSQNPGGTLPSGISSFGKYFEMATANKDAISWPVMIKVYYTANDLIAAHITDEKQLVGIYYYDSGASSWKLYSSTGVNTNDITVNGINYAGYIWANADHFTPITIGTDITAPAKPANFTASTGDGEISLTWDKVSDATGYYVRYREGTSVDNKEYTIIFLDSADKISTKVTGIKNGILYEFGVKTVDAFGNLSDWAVVIASPTSSFILAKAETVKAAVTTTGEQVSPTETTPSGETEITTIGPDEGKVKSESTFSWTRFWITLAILIIAAGAAYGGYYGYQWWMEKPKKQKKEEAPKPPEKTGRW